MEILDYAKRGLRECNKILDDPEQNINYDYWKGKRIVFNSILQILNKPLNEEVEDRQPKCKEYGKCYAQEMFGLNCCPIPGSGCYLTQLLIKMLGGFDESIKNWERQKFR